MVMIVFRKLFIVENETISSLLIDYIWNRIQFWRRFSSVLLHLSTFSCSSDKIYVLMMKFISSFISCLFSIVVFLLNNKRTIVEFRTLLCLSVKYTGKK